MTPEPTLASVTGQLARAGCVAAEEEAAELVAAAGGDAAVLGALVARRCTGEPLAWVVGSVVFCGETVLVHPGVYVPRWQSEPLAEEAADRLPEGGTAVDLCTGSGALAVVLARRRPGARVLASELDPVAAACARANGVAVVRGDLGAGLDALAGHVDVVVGVVPYVPTDQLAWLPRDVLEHEPVAALDGGAEGIDVAGRAARLAARLLVPGGWLGLELGGDQDALLQPLLADLGFEAVEARHDEDGDLRALWARLA